MVWRNQSLAWKPGSFQAHASSLRQCDLAAIPARGGYREAEVYLGEGPRRAMAPKSAPAVRAAGQPVAMLRLRRAGIRAQIPGQCAPAACAPPPVVRQCRRSAPAAKIGPAALPPMMQTVPTAQC